MDNVNPQTNLPESYLATRPLDKLRLSMVPRSRAADAAHLTLFQLQDLPSPEEQMMGVAVLFTAFAQRLRLDPSELHDMGLAILQSRTDGDHVTSNSLQTLKDFAGIRLAGDASTTFY